MDTTAAIATAAEQPLTLAEVELDEPRADEVRVRMVACGVCHTDAIVRDQWYPTPLPAVLGHEGAGVVEAVGTGVGEIEVGDHVLLSFAHCGHCPNCVEGWPAYCHTFFERNFGGRRGDGTTAFSRGGEPVSSHFFGQSSFAGRTNVHVNSVVTVPESAPLETLAPLGCGIQTGAGAVLNTLDPQPGSTLVIFGAGAVGLSALLAAKVAACGTIIVVDLVPQRLDLARELGATHVVSGQDGDPAEKIREITGGGAEYALETTGVPAVFETMTRSLRALGVGGVVGAAALGTHASMDIGTLLPTGITIRMIIEGDSVPSTFIPRLIGLWEAGLFPFDTLLRSYPLDAINQAFTDSAEGRTLKPVVVF
ncbi:NAD(P)-dependent alcohol dehydrogenase [Saccharomonospora iraqiensis]|uniref:NAD(P)-dependent alcohol dehydrogenase n=1 Tax=Saccharomonospora iraqiensis TaxID=52698 RepID=UPI00041056F7|nr:NAD(P)-dependent alcohol dehydrogenase [Saccharomonospora iraqiensis]